MMRGSTSDPAERFLDLACLAYTSADSPRRRDSARRLLELHPEIAGANLYTVALLGDVARLRARLDADASMATQCGGPRGWDALLYLCYGRVDAGDPVAAARLLLERGADPNTHVMLGDYRFSALCGAMGEGEQGVRNQPPHSRARSLARLLLDCGADPNESQGLYNTMFTPDDGWLELLLERGLTARHPVNWKHGRPDPVYTLDYLLAWAARNGVEARVDRLLAHGADPNVRDFYDGKLAHSHALLNGYTDIAAKLVARGAQAAELGPSESFRAACMRGDWEETRARARENPALLADAGLLQDVAYHGHLEGVRMLLELGISVNARAPDGSTALHHAAWRGHAELAALLQARGADLAIRDGVHHATPIGWAAHGSGAWLAREAQRALAQLWLEQTEDALDLARFGRAEQLAALIDRDAGALGARDAAGNTLLHVIDPEPLYDERARPEQTVAVLLERNADPEARNADGQTPLERARALGVERVVTALLAAEKSRSGTAH